MHDDHSDILLSVMSLMVIAVRTRSAATILAALDPEQVKVAKTSMFRCVS